MNQISHLLLIYNSAKMYGPKPNLILKIYNGGWMGVVQERAKGWGKGKFSGKRLGFPHGPIQNHCFIDNKDYNNNVVISNR